MISVGTKTLEDATHNLEAIYSGPQLDGVVMLLFSSGKIVAAELKRLGLLQVVEKLPKDLMSSRNWMIE